MTNKKKNITLVALFLLTATFCQMISAAEVIPANINVIYRVFGEMCPSELNAKEPVVFRFQKDGAGVQWTDVVKPEGATLVNAPQSLSAMGIKGEKDFILPKEAYIKLANQLTVPVNQLVVKFDNSTENLRVYEFQSSFVYFGPNKGCGAASITSEPAVIPALRGSLMP